MATPPDVTDLRAAFEAATGKLTPQELAMISEKIIETDGLITSTDEFASFPELVSELGDSVESTSGASLGNIMVTARASGTLNTKCMGAATDGAENAALLQFTFSATGLFPTVWGTFSECALDRGLLPPAVLNGDFIGYLPNQEGFKPVLDEWLLRFSGTVTVDGEVLLEGTIDVQRKGDSTTTRLPLSDGSWVFLTTSDGGATYTVEDDENTYQCDIEARQCTSQENTFTF